MCAGPDVPVSAEGVPTILRLRETYIKKTEIYLSPNTFENKKVCAVSEQANFLIIFWVYPLCGCL